MVEKITSRDGCFLLKKFALIQSQIQSVARIRNAEIASSSPILWDLGFENCERNHSRNPKQLLRLQCTQVWNMPTVPDMSLERALPPALPRSGARTSTVTMQRRCNLKKLISSALGCAWDVRKVWLCTCSQCNHRIADSLLSLRPLCAPEP